MDKSRKSGGQWRGIVTLVVLTLSTTLGFVPIFFVSVLKIIPIASWQHFCTKILHKIAALWVDFNNLYIDFTKPASLEIHGIESVRPSDWYLIVANHQSWLDIVVLQYALNRPTRLPILMFFIKNSLKWVPLLGFAWWSMGYPFMKRYSKDYLARNPHKKGEDLTSTLKAIKRFKKMPASIVSFVEGTRFTSDKKEQQQASYQHLLKPRAGGISFVIGAMHKEIDSLLDVTISYKNKNCSIWDYFCHRLDPIKVQIRQIPIPYEFRQIKLLECDDLQSKFRNWLNEQWLEKDRLMKALKCS